MGTQIRSTQFLTTESRREGHDNEHIKSTLNPVSLPSFNSPHPVFRGMIVAKSRSPFSCQPKSPHQREALRLRFDWKGLPSNWCPMESRKGGSSTTRCNSPSPNGSIGNTKPFNLSDSQKGSGHILISFNFFGRHTRQRTSSLLPRDGEVLSQDQDPRSPKHQVFGLLPVNCNMK